MNVPRHGGAECRMGETRLPAKGRCRNRSPPPAADTPSHARACPRAPGRERAETGHPWRLGITGGVSACAAPELDFERFGKEPFQGDAARGGERLGLPEHDVWKLDGHFHAATFHKDRLPSSRTNLGRRDDLELIPLSWTPPPRPLARHRPCLRRPTALTRTRRPAKLAAMNTRRIPNRWWWTG